MVQNSLALLGFSLLIAIELMQFRLPGFLTRILGYAGYGAVGVAVVILALTPRFAGAGFDSLSLEGAALILLSLISATLLAWSVFLEIPAERKRLGLGRGDLVSSGTYRLCRHPGFWWLCVLAICTATLKGFQSHSFFAFLMIGLDFLLVYIQDKYTFPRVFTGYSEYRKHVPFLIPRIRTGPSGGMRHTD